MGGGGGRGGEGVDPGGNINEHFQVELEEVTSIDSRCAMMTCEENTGFSFARCI